MCYNDFLLFLKKEKKKHLTLAKACNFQIHHFIEGGALNLSEYFPTLIFFFFKDKKKKLNRKIKHISLTGVSCIFLVWCIFLQLIF